MHYNARGAGRKKSPDRLAAEAGVERDRAAGMTDQQIRTNLRSPIVKSGHVPNLLEAVARGDPAAQQLEREIKHAIVECEQARPPRLCLFCSHAFDHDLPMHL
jgi:hypothetical protein